MKTKKYLKPIEIDAYFKYECPSPKCRENHWLTLKEAKTKKFKIVCGCGNVLYNKKIKKLKILYDTSNSSQDIPVPFEKCFESLSKYGFDRNESDSLIKDIYSKTKNTDVSFLVIEAIKLFGEKKSHETV